MTTTIRPERIHGTYHLTIGPGDSEDETRITAHGIETMRGAMGHHRKAAGADVIDFTAAMVAVADVVSRAIERQACERAMPAPETET